MATVIQEGLVETAEHPSGLRGLLGQRNFRLLWIGEGVSLLGDQFYMIALPWLVLQLTGDAFAMGTVLALAGIPRALFMLVGGALTDRFSARNLMLGSNILRLALITALAGLVMTGQIALWMLYGFALLFGLADAFFFPAQNAIVPQIVAKKDLQMANSLVQGTMQVSLFAGPVLAGVLIALLDGGQVAAGGEAVPDLRGIGLAFLIDALTFLVSLAALWSMRFERQLRSSEGPSEGVWGAIREALVNVWRDPALRAFFLMIGAANFLINGPIIVGIPLIADTRLPEGAAAYGIIMSAYGGGSLLGIILSGVLPRPAARRMGIVLGIIWSGLGIGVAALGLVTNTAAAALLMLTMGAANGYVVVLFMTWLQTRTPDSMLGRIMSLLMFASVGLQPISTALTGALIEFNMVALFIVAGLLMTVMVLVSMLNPAVRAMEPPAAA